MIIAILVIIVVSQACLPIDLLSKGNIVLECWDQNETSSDFLGGTEVYFADIFHKGEKDERCLAEGLHVSDYATGKLPDGRPAKFVYTENDTNEEPELFSAEPQPYETKYVTSVYKAQRVELTGSSIPISADAAPCISFEIFCIPPLPDNLQFPPRQHHKASQDIWKQRSRWWNSCFRKWISAYLEWFPDAFENRRFLCVAEHPQTRKLYPLPAFLTPIAMTEQVCSVSEILHWIKNMTFLIPQQMRKTGRIQRWLTPNYMLTSRKGGIHDHAVLLCNCLLGLNFDAYVCKGTVDNGAMEHCWVMVRYPNGWVTFIETTNKERYNLPYRWLYPLTHPNVAEEFKAGEYNYLLQRFNQAISEININKKPEEKMQLLHVFDEEVVPDVDPNLEDVLEKKEPPRKVIKKSENDRIALLNWLDSNGESLTIFPNKAFLNPTSTLAFVPYSSIEVVFNHQQLWGNLQNHHPAVITYDLNDPALWKPFLSESVEPIDSMVFVAPSTRDKYCELLASEIQADIGENIRVWRHRKGLETYIDHSTEKTVRLEKYFDLLEFKLRLDTEYDPGPPRGHQGWSAWKAEELYEHLEKLPEELKPEEQQISEEIFNVSNAPGNMVTNNQETPYAENKFYNTAGHATEMVPPRALNASSQSSIADNFRKKTPSISSNMSDTTESASSSDSSSSSSSGTSDLEETCRRKNIKILRNDEPGPNISHATFGSIQPKFQSFKTMEIHPEKDVLWAQFETTYNEAKINFELSAKHGASIEDYADFEARVLDGTAKNSLFKTLESPVTKQTVFNKFSAVAPATPLQKKVNWESEDTNLNVESLGFKIKEHPTKIKKPTLEQEKPPASEAIQENPVRIIDEKMILKEPLKKEIRQDDAYDIIRHRLPIMNEAIAQDQINKWSHYYKLESLYYRWQRLKFPVRPCNTFCGFPMHLSTTDMTDIRTFLLSSRRFRKVLDIPVENITYCVRCKAYPLMGGVISMWVFLGYEIPWTEKDKKNFYRKKHQL